MMKAINDQTEGEFMRICDDVLDQAVYSNELNSEMAGGI